MLRPFKVINPVVLYPIDITTNNDILQHNLKMRTEIKVFLKDLRERKPSSFYADLNIKEDFWFMYEEDAMMYKMRFYPEGMNF